MLLNKSGLLVVPALLMALSAPSFAFSKKRTIDGGKLIVAKDVPENQYKILESDIQYLKSTPITQGDFQIQEMMRLNTLSGSTLESWMTDRVQYIVSQIFEIKSSLYVKKMGYSFEHADERPTVAVPTKIPGKGTNQSGSVVKTIMTNIGGAFYFAGKSAGALLGAKIPGVGKVPVTSPRVGLLQVGEGLFGMPKNMAGIKINSPAAAIFRLGVLFHEARHSDGNGKTLGFFHAICPAGHEYEGFGACDRSLNGPYTIGALTTKALADSCTTCTVAEREGLKLVYLDYFNRVILEEKPTAAEIERKALPLKTQLEVCKMFASSPNMNFEMCKDVPAVQKQLDEILAGVGMNGSKAVNGDDAPEGRR
ncbi:MAG: hypothetical protein HY074_17585 [Deltaproteobacteria bacterium]|nr:hypothetical protein [Deltaproteobacteria bacterium]